jgi:hypothetical protein
MVTSDSRRIGYVAFGYCTGRLRKAAATQKQHL